MAEKYKPLFIAPHPLKDSHPGFISPGNIDILERAKLSVPNPLDGRPSSVYSTSVNFGDGEVLIPRVIPNGRGGWTVDVSKRADQAIEHYKKTGEHLGVFKTSEDATAYGDILHKQQEAAGALKQKPLEVY